MTKESHFFEKKKKEEKKEKEPSETAQTIVFFRNVTRHRAAIEVKKKC